jgi:hypothetical protein
MFLIAPPLIVDLILEKLHSKINLQIFDLQNVLTLCYDSNCSVQKSYNIAIRDIEAYEDIYLIDHMYSHPSTHLCLSPPSDGRLRIPRQCMNN